MPYHALLAIALASAPTDTAAINSVDYHLTFDRELAARRTVRVEMLFQVADSGDVLLSLPAWAPGVYRIADFSRWVSGFDASRDTVPIDWDKADPDTWRISNPGPGPVRVAFEVLADSLEVGMSWARDEFLLLNGTSVFLYPEGADLADYAANVRVSTEQDWTVATGMTPGDSARTYRERSYHELVDMPFFIGRFDFDSLQVGSVWMRFATYPEGSVRGENRALTWEALARMLPPMRNVFGDVPFRTYTVLQIADSSFAGGSGLEHANSHVDIVTPLLIGNPMLNGLYAHEIFHAWNAERLRPAAMVPYRYDRRQPTPLLWISEGVTDYYADLALVRGGLITPDQFYALTTQKIDQVASTPPVALEDASLDTWLSPTDGTAYIYYPKGSLAGLLLDIMIRDASDNRSSLDSVLRALYRDTFAKGRGFTDAEWWAAVTRAGAGRDFEEFEQRYVDGREPFPWDSVLPLAGLRLQSDTAFQPHIGVSTELAEEGVAVLEVVPGSMAARAGVLAGDRLLSIGEIEVQDANYGAEFRRLYANRAGDELEIVVRRADERLELEGRVELAPSVTTRVIAMPSPPARALRIRDGILTGSGGS